MLRLIRLNKARLRAVAAELEDPELGSAGAGILIKGTNPEVDILLKHLQALIEAAERDEELVAELVEKGLSGGGS